MNILGVSFLSDASACVLIDGKLASCISEERINRQKLWHGLPRQAISEALRIAGVTLNDIDLIATHGESLLTPNLGAFLEKRKKIESANLSSAIKAAQLRAIDERLEREKLVLGQRTPTYLAEISEYAKPLFTCSHHTAHAACAYFGSGWEDCYVLTADGWGEDASSTLWRASNGHLDQVSFSNTFDSLGYFYGSVTRSLGFTPHRHEGKVLGLSARGGSCPQSYPAIRDMVAYDPKNMRFLGLMEHGIYKPQYQNIELDNYVSKFTREDVAAAVQLRIEEVVCELIKDISGSRFKLAVAGGVFANVKLNQCIREIDSVEEFYVFPNMGDGGLCVGAAWLAHQKKTNTMPIAFETALLGNEITSPEVREALDGSGLDYEEIKDIEIHVASELAREQPVVRVAGRMEFGPRALGNRSILCNANDPTINNWLNTRLHRSEFMPFAPATLSSVADQYFLGVKNLGTSSEYMTMTVDCTKKMKDEAPAAVHIDGTARPQIVSVERYPELHKILTHYRKVTGLGNIINTSFNMHEEPIVRNAEDAIRAFKRSGLPWLALNNYLIKGRT